MASIATTVYDQDIQALNVVNGLNPTTHSIPADPMALMTGFIPETLTNHIHQSMIQVDPTYIPKVEQPEDFNSEMHLLAEDPTLYMPVNTLTAVPQVAPAVQSLSSFAPEIATDTTFTALGLADPSLGMGLSPGPLSTPSPPTTVGSPILGLSTTYNVATANSLDSALTPTTGVTSPTGSNNSLSPVSAPSPFASAGQSPPLSLPSPGPSVLEDGTITFDEDSSLMHQKPAVMSALQAMVENIYAVKDAMERENADPHEVQDELRQRMNAISRQAARLTISNNNETTPPPPPTFAEVQALMSLTEVAGYPNHTALSFDQIPMTYDLSRKRSVSDLDMGEDRLVKSFKREPQEDAPLAPDLLAHMSSFPALSAIPLSSQMPQSRPVSRPPTPSSTRFAPTPQGFGSVTAPIQPMTMLPSVPSVPMGVPLSPLGAPVLSPGHTYSQGGWSEPQGVATRHHQSLSLGSINIPMSIQMPPMPIRPTLASGPTTPTTVKPALNRSSRSGSLNKLFDAATFNFLETPTEPPLKRAALGTRAARNSSVGSNWYFGNDMSPPSDEPGTNRNTPSDDEDDGSTDSEYNDKHNSHITEIASSIPVASQSISDIPQEYQSEVDRVFFEFLNKVCSNLDAKDSKGDHIHQTLMAKKMQRLDESPDFRPFKFRIQAFTAAFLEELARQGYPEDKIPMKKVRNYLWHCPYILRFNEDGKKAKSKGNHIWILEARKLAEAKWDFRPFLRKLAGTPPPVAYCGLKWSWRPRVWDPQASFTNVPVTYSSPNLPPWLSWQDDELSGTPPSDAEACSVTVHANYTLDGVEGQLSKTLSINIAPVSSVESNAYPRSRRPSVSDAPPRRSTSDSALNMAAQRSKTRNSTPMPVPGESSSTRVVRVLQAVAQRVTEEVESQAESPPLMKTGQPTLVKSKEVLEQTVKAMDREMAGHENRPYSKRLAIAAQQVVIQAAANVIADRNVSIGRAPVVPNKSTAVQRVSVNELSDATHDAIVQAVETNPSTSNGVDIIVAAATILKAQAPVADQPHPPFTAISRPPTHPSSFIQNLATLAEYS
ncbi:hypothetical protein FA15DRAFT_663500 [Coprinopsis marcescibilis]|uniref:Uncharacterized protein n=1 Tax=Coprinopsis marcescibilis TaxID=230819 RepID=A0A5C3LDY5_COPMA|nr:hypothetical protein FA15DRAFT_663500 [Coprinopsis marcescibilis]